VDENHAAGERVNPGGIDPRQRARRTWNMPRSLDDWRRSEATALTGWVKSPKLVDQAPVGFTLSVFGERLAAPQLDRQPPDQKGGRSQLDQAVDAEDQQRERTRGYTGANTDGALDHHPGERKVFENERLPNQSTAPSGRYRVSHWSREDHPS
jgi:hypothetical protein